MGIVSAAFLVHGAKKPMDRNERRLRAFMTAEMTVAPDRLMEMRKDYYAVRRRVFNEATKPVDGNIVQHEENKRKFRSAVEQVCDAAQLARYMHATDEARVHLWHHLWTKIKYAGIRAKNAANEINCIKGIFDDHRRFADPAWDVEIEWDNSLGKHVLRRGGAQVHNFLRRSGDFEGCLVNRKLTKLEMIVRIARQYDSFCSENPAKSPLAYVTDDILGNDVWSVHAGLLHKGYRADLTCCHFMMDIGFQLIKPDVVLSRLFFKWGWLHEAILRLPTDLTEADLVGNGKYGSRFLYSKPKIYRPIIDLAKQIVSDLDEDELKERVGWYTTNRLREFDFFVVKAGQQPDQSCGIEHTLFQGDD